MCCVTSFAGEVTGLCRGETESVLLVGKKHIVTSLKGFAGGVLLRITGLFVCEKSCYHGVMTIALGIETSCDDTAVSLVQQEGRRLLANCVVSTPSSHETWGGIVPELAARDHVDSIDSVLKQALKEANFSLDNIDIIAATQGPGLAGSLLVGFLFAKTLAFCLKKPFFGINHLEGHALSPRLLQRIDFPYLLLLVSGGHSQIIQVNAVGDYLLHGTTVDDAAGEAFDKAARCLSLPFPGGPAIEKIARYGHAKRFAFPRPFHGESHCHFSFAGLKTAMKRQCDALGTLTPQQTRDLAASFQAAMVDSIVHRVNRAFDLLKTPVKSFVMAGGVAANQRLRQTLKRVCAQRRLRFIAPPAWLCTDNAAMIAWTALEKLPNNSPAPLNASIYPRWPLQTL